MRLNIKGEIIEKVKPNKTNYKHETYSMILNNLTTEKAQQIHTREKFYRLFTFSNLYINKNKLHFYIGGENKLIDDFIKHIMFNQLIRIDDMVIKITDVIPLEDLPKRKEYKFKTDLIVNISKDGKCVLSNDLDYVAERLNIIAKNKYKALYGEEINDDIKVEFIEVKKQFDKYKNHHVNSWKSIFKINGSYDLIKLIYNVGIGENTSSGHGFIWEV